MAGQMFQMLQNALGERKPKNSCFKLANCRAIVVCIVLFPHIFVWGSCFWFCTPAFSCPPPPPAALLLHIIHITHNSTHTPCPQLVITQLAHTQFNSHTQLYSHNLSSHNLSSYNLLTHNSTHTPCRQLVLLPLLLVHTTCHHTTCHPPWFHVAGVVLGDIDLHFVWQAWHVWHWVGSGGALGPEWPGWPPRLLAWQAWHFATATLVSRRRRGTW